MFEITNIQTENNVLKIDFKHEGKEYRLTFNKNKNRKLLYYKEILNDRIWGEVISWELSSDIKLEIEAIDYFENECGRTRLLLLF